VLDGSTPSARDHPVPVRLHGAFGIRLFQFVGSKWGKLDCLVNNAGVWWHNPLTQFDESASSPPAHQLARSVPLPVQALPSPALGNERRQPPRPPAGEAFTPLRRFEGAISATSRGHGAGAASDQLRRPGLGRHRHVGGACATIRRRGRSGRDPTRPRRLRRGRRRPSSSSPRRTAQITGEISTSTAAACSVAEPRQPPSPDLG
jgi:hypothetical protein